MRVGETGRAAEWIVSPQATLDWTVKTDTHPLTVWDESVFPLGSPRPGMRIEEGGVEITVPGERDGASDGTNEDVFFNPEQELNRDITVAVLRAYQRRVPEVGRYLDAMAASGIRGVRAAAEGYDVTCVDVDPEATALAEKNLADNENGGEAICRDVNAHLYESSPSVTDLDPYGTPIPFADAAVSNTRKLVCVTATDTAPLCGAHLNSGIRKYGAIPRNTEYHPEMGLRTLLSALTRTAARYDLAADPICSHVSRHYARTYLELNSGAQAADSVLEELGHVYHCEDCLWRDSDHGLIAAPPDGCPRCGGNRTLTAGPLWLGAVANSAFTTTVREAIDDEMGTAARARRLLDRVSTELDTPTHYDQHRLCEQWGRPASGMETFISQLREAGHAASRAHYSGTAFKSDATIPEIRAITSSE